MYNIEVNNSITQLIWVFHLFGIWTQEPETTRRKLIYFGLLFSFFLSLAAGSYVSSDETETIFLAVIAILVAISNVRFYYILWKKSAILGYVHQIGNHSIKNRLSFLQVNNKIKMFAIFAYLYQLMIFFILLFLIITALPVVSSQRRLPYNIWFPYKQTEIGYWLAFAYVVFGTVLNITCSSLNIIVWYIMMNCSIKYEIMCSQAKHITEIGIGDEDEPKSFIKEQVKFVKIHQKLYETIDQFTSFFTSLFFIQISTSGVVICGSVYALAFGSLENLMQLLIYVGILIYGIFDIFMVMFFGNEIRFSSNDLSYSFFQSNWIEQSEASKKCVIILMEVLKKPQQLVILKLYPLNLRTFTSILNLSYSMFNILQSMK